jgi:hypothetical protein
VLFNKLLIINELIDCLANFLMSIVAILQYNIWSSFMRCCGYSITQSPFRIATAVATGVITAGFAVKTGLIASEILSGCVKDASWNLFYQSTANCEHEISEIVYSGASTLIAALATTVLSFRKSSEIKTQSKTDERSGFADQRLLDAFIEGVVSGHKEAQDVTQTRSRSRSTGATPRRLAQGINGIVVIDPAKGSANANLRADIKNAYE